MDPRLRRPTEALSVAPFRCACGCGRVVPLVTDCFGWAMPQVWLLWEKDDKRGRQRWHALNSVADLRVEYSPLLSFLPQLSHKP
ncbi:hypothetical protein GW17_00007135 [Ensete ventricosum]|nr:hypothetical protein GW17_00007135 [Ensete ventricosum]